MVYRFGEFRLDGDTRQLLSPHGERHLSPKAFDLLTILIGHRPRALPKAELQERLWPNTFVQEANLASLVAEIRRALADSATHPRFVRTVHRFGYAFAADAAADAPADASLRRRAQPHLCFGGREILLMDGAQVLGRSPEATIHVDAPGVSRTHAVIRIHGEQATLEDLGSKNGTSVDGTRLTEAVPLRDGCRIRLGTAELTFRIGLPGSPTETVS